MSDPQIKYAITADDRFTATFRRLRSEMQGVRDQAAGVAAGIVRIAGPVGLLSGVLGAAGGVSLFRQLTQDLAALQDAADATGATVEKLSALEAVALRNGDSLDTVSAATLRLNKVLAETQEDGPMARQLRRIGLNAAELRRLDPADAVAAVARALSGYADDGERARLVQELFGKSAAQLAGFLRDAAEAGDLAATTTRDVVEQADRFNKQMAQLRSEVNLAARSLVGGLVPALSQTLLALRELSRGPGLGAAALEAFKGNAFATAQEGLEKYNRDIADLDAKLRALRSDTRPLVRAGSAGEISRLQAQRAELEKFATAYRNILNANSAGAGRGALVPGAQALPSVGAPPAARAAAPPPPPVSEAQRYLEQLQKQGEKLQDLSAYEQLLADIQAKRIDGLTPRLTAELKLAAQRVDLQRQINTETQREADLQAVLAGAQQRRLDDALRLLEQTPTGQLQGLSGQGDKLLELSRSLPESDPRQRQILEAMQQLRKQADEIGSPVDAAKDKFDLLADAIEKSMDRSTAAISDFVISGRGDVDDLLAAFSRDVLRDLIEEPVRDSMKQVAKTIRESLRGSEFDLFKTLASLFGGGDVPVVNMDIGSLLGFTGRAGGGSVNKGDLVRWQENGREWFIPGADGAVVNQSQMRAMGGGAPVNQTNTFVINGGDPEEVERRISRALARNNAGLARSQRLRGAFAG